MQPVRRFRYAGWRVRQFPPGLRGRAVEAASRVCKGSVTPHTSGSQGSPAFRMLEITTNPDNIASRLVIEANGDVLVEHFLKPQQFGRKPGLRFRITFT